jgi:intein/homing endonuclease
MTLQLVESASKKAKLSDVTETLSTFGQEFDTASSNLRKLFVKNRPYKKLMDSINHKIFRSYEVIGDSYQSKVTLGFYDLQALKPEHLEVLRRDRKIDLMSGKVVNASVITTSESAYSATVEFSIVIPFSGIKSITDAVGKDGIQHLINFMIKQFSVEGKIPAVFDLSYSVPKTNTDNGTVILPDGSFYFIPKERVDNRIEYIKYLVEHGGEGPRGMSVLFNPDNEEFTYTNTYGELQTFSVAGHMQPTDAHKKDMLEKDCNSLMVSLRRFHIADHIEPEIIAILSNNSWAPIYQLEKSDMNKVVSALRDALESRMAEIVPNSYYSAKAIVELLATTHSEYKSIAERVDSKFKSFRERTAKDLGPIPSTRSDLMLFPHQAESISKLEVAEDTAILDVSTGGGKCVVGDTILFQKGKGLVEIKSLFKKCKIDKNIESIFPAHNIKLFGRNGYKDVNSLYYSGKKKIRTLISDLGLELGGSFKHPIVKLDTNTGDLNFVKLEDINVGDVIAVQYNQQCWGENTKINYLEGKSVYNKRFPIDKSWLPKYLTEELSELLGWVVSEGSVSSSNIKIWQKDSKLLRRIKRLAVNCFGSDKIRTGKRKGISYVEIRNNGSFSLRIFTKSLQLLHRSGDKRIPRIILEAPKKYVTAFLRGLYEGDGTSSDKRRVSYSTKSKKLASDLQILLLNYGLIAYRGIRRKIIDYSSPKLYTGYRLQISGYDQIKLFSKEVGFISKTKNKPIENYLKSKDPRISTNRRYESIPQFKKVIRDSYLAAQENIEQLGLKEADTMGRVIQASVNNIVGHVGGWRNSTYTLTEGSATVSLLRNIVKSYQSSEYKEVFNKTKLAEYVNNFSNLIKDLAFTVVVEIRDSKKTHPLYDVHIPDGHEFCSNGLVSHNTLILLFDVLKTVMSGKAKRPLVVAPNTILGQWVGQINYFSDGKINAFCLNTTTSKNWGRRIGESEDALKAQALQAPANTIFLTSYSFLILNGVETLESGWYFPNIEFFKSELEVDYVALDESQNIKNSRSQTHNACIQLRSVPRRRIATGTLVVNTPMDLVGQVAFLDPRALGTDVEFAEKYGAPGGVRYGRGKAKVYRWRQGADKEIRERLATHTFYLQYREKDWAPTLPKIGYGYHPLQFTPAQKAEYKKIVDSTMEEIMSDPSLKAAWLQYLQVRTEEEDEELSVVGAQILAKFTTLEQFLTDPTFSPFLKKADLAHYDKISPKVAKMDELIQATINKGSKCIVATHFKRGAQHLWENSKFKNQGVYYDASVKQNLVRFISDPDIKVIFAVQQSISEGLNLQMASRIIMADLDWTPGKMKQLIARIYRPTSPEIDMTKTVDIDFIYMDGSADVAKLARLIHKRAFNASVLEGSPVPYPPPPAFSDTVFFLTQNQLVGGGYFEAERKLNDWFDKVVEDSRTRGGYEPIVPKLEGEIKGKSIQTPWVMGMPLPPDVEGEPLPEVLRAEGYSLDDISAAKDFLEGKFVRTEFGIGRIQSAYKSKVRIRYEDGSVSSTKIFTVALLDQAQFSSKEAAAEFEKAIRTRNKVNWKRGARIAVDISGKKKKFKLGTVIRFGKNTMAIEYDNGEVSIMPTDDKNILGKGVEDKNPDTIDGADIDKWIVKEKLEVPRKRVAADFDIGDRLVINIGDKYYLGKVSKRRERGSGKIILFIKLDSGDTVKMRTTSPRIVGFGIDERHSKPGTKADMEKWLVTKPETKKGKGKEKEEEILFFKVGDRAVVDYYGKQKEFFIGTVKRIKGNKLVLRFDDEEKKVYKIDSPKLIGLGVGRKNSNSISRDKLDKWVTKYRIGMKKEEKYNTELSFGTLNGIPVLMADSDNPNMSSLGFEQFPSFWRRRIVSKTDGLEVLRYLENKFTISTSDQLKQILKTFKKVPTGKFIRPVQDVEITKLLKQMRSAKPLAKLGLYYAYLNSKHYFVSFNRKLKMQKYSVGVKRFRPSNAEVWYMPLKSFKVLSKEIGKVEKSVEISNSDAFRAFLREEFSITIK